VYLHPAALGVKYASNAQGISREIGIPFPAHQALRRQGHRVVKTESPTAIADGLMVTGSVPRVTDFEDTGGRFFVDAACSTPDCLSDDQSLFFETREGIVVLLGCAHSGVINTLRYISDLSGGKPIHAVIGGMHLANASPERISRTIEELGRLGVRLLSPAHCTGMRAAAAMWLAFPNNCVACHAGKVFEFEMA
jgi:7,8-dihydropterin-6-yl-methyl-4-(beta-D-ribofuranosyl)aminobenzene 5'-phosphate synthase